MTDYQFNENMENIPPCQIEVSQNKILKPLMKRKILSDITNGHRGIKRDRTELGEHDCNEESLLKKNLDSEFSLHCLKLTNSENEKHNDENSEADIVILDKHLGNEYEYDIWKYLYELETELDWPKVNYMSKQKELTNDMRSVLVDWLVTVAEEYNMNEHTIHLSVNYIDRFLSCMAVVREKFQLVGAAAMMLAVKVEEVNILDANEWVYLCGNTYTSKQVNRMEKLLLKVLKFKVNVPTIYTFIHQLCKMNKLDKKTLYAAMYISELTLLEGDLYMQHVPSMLATASVILARHLLQRRNPQLKRLETCSGYNFKQLRPIIVKQYETFKDSPTKEQQAIQTKYETARYCEVARISSRALYFEDHS